MKTPPNRDQLNWRRRIYRDGRSRLAKKRRKNEKAVVERRGKEIIKSNVKFRSKENTN